MKKINPKVAKLVVGLLSVLIAGGAALAIDKVTGEANIEKSLDAEGSGFE